MSAHNRQGNRYAAGKFNGKLKNTNAGPRMEWKPKTKIATDESLGSASSGKKHDPSLTGECALVKASGYSPKPGLGIHSKEESLLPVVKVEASGMETFEPMPNSCQKTDKDSKQSSSMSASDYSSKGSQTFSSPVAFFLSVDDNAEKGKQFREKGDISGKLDDTDPASSVMFFDICPKKVDPVVKLKPPLHVTNKEKRNQQKCLVEGQTIEILRPGMVLMKGYISRQEQMSIVKTCRELGIGHGGFYQPGYRDGAKLHLKMMCLGKNWDPQSSQYSDTRPIDNSKPPEIPGKFHDAVKQAIHDSNAHIQKENSKAGAGKFIPSMLPDICIVNFYTKGGKLGLHQDKDESSESIDRGLPVVSFSIGASAEFLYGDVRDIDKTEKVDLESGDVLIFGGRSRSIFHGVTGILPETTPTWLLEATDMCPGRLNLTFRQF